MRNAEVIRQWKILKTIETGRFTGSARLAEEHGVTERMIRRDIEALQEARFPLYDDRVDGKKVWRLVPGYKLRLTQNLTMGELAALYFSKNMLAFLGGAPFAQDLETAFVKIREALPQRSLPFLSRVQDLFSARPDPWKDYSKKQDVIAALIDAILHQRQSRIAYYSFNSRRTKSYEIDPYRLVYYRGALYLYARAHEYQEIRTFAVERVQQVEVREAGFEMPADFTPGQLYLLLLLFRSLPQKVTTKMPSSRLLTPFYPDPRLKSVPYHFSYPPSEGRMRNSCLPVPSLPKSLRKVYTTNHMGAKGAFKGTERFGFWEKKRRYLLIKFHL